MNVQDLIYELKTISDKSIDVWVAKDPEGNDFNPLEDVTVEPVDEDEEDFPQVVLWP